MVCCFAFSPSSVFCPENQGPGRKTVCLARWQRAWKLGLSIVLNQVSKKEGLPLCLGLESPLQVLGIEPELRSYQRAGICVLELGLIVSG